MARKHRFPSRCPCTKTVISYSLFKLQAGNLEHTLPTPSGIHRNCILGGRIEYALILAIGRARSLKKIFWLVFLWVFSYHIYCVILSYIILTILIISTHVKVFYLQWYQLYAYPGFLGLSNRQFTLGTSFKQDVEKKEAFHGTVELT